ncbi:hypothetical protein [Frigoriglobus tundricola]|uniref:HEAT repeat domain-containing protein n=1 Tax=Frigoriglobus tundricola TaxID=2774151 RepID=A0A6M5YV24_9BACT|nr:hypothetical protein [Frigoriglobus tundricola]QJW97310.1 hypothetical protein FTUN_4880 [Frigoriglobus tundricola]
MSDTPTFASLLLQWAGGGSSVRVGVYAHLRAHPAEATAVEAFIRDELKTGNAWKRVIAAEAVIEVYRDEEAAASALAGVMRWGDPSAVTDAVPVLQKLAPERAGSLLRELVVHAPDVVRSLAPADHRWAGAIAATTGADLWVALLPHVGADGESAFLMGLAEAAPRVRHDLSTVEPVVRLGLFQSGPGYAAGAALWRLTWRIHRDWLASIDPQSPRLDDPPLLALLVDVLTEQLGRRADLTVLVRTLLVRLAGAAPAEFKRRLERLADLGGRGWSVLLPLLGDESVPPAVRAEVFGAAALRPAVLPLAHHHAHAVVSAYAASHDGAKSELLKAAGRVLATIGAPAGSAFSDVLALITRYPGTARSLVPVLVALAPGFPTPAAALARTLDHLRRSVSFSTAHDAFVAVAEGLAATDLGAGPRLVEDTTFDPRVLDSLLQQPAWQDAPPNVRREHARVLADGLASPRPEVRVRAADRLRHYPDQVPAVWPVLVAALAGGDEKVALPALALVRHLEPVADAVEPELIGLFREPNPTYAARAVVALGRLGRMSAVAGALYAAVTARDAVWGWAVLRGAADRVAHAHGLLRELAHVFTSAPPDVAAQVRALLYPPEPPDEVAISAHVRPDGWPRVNWDGVHQRVSADSEGGALFVALMCAYGSAGFAAQKIWMIKHQRATAGNGLAEAKAVVEETIDRLTPTATPDDRRECVRAYFGPAPLGLPKPLADLIGHPLSWYRWAGLELLDAWCSEPNRVADLIADRLWDRSALVRARARRMHRGA